MSPQPPPAMSGPSGLFTPLRGGRVAVIGAGVAGLQAARQLVAAGYTTRVFEQSGHIGGLWLYKDDDNGKENDNGNDTGTTSPIYRSLRSNIPQQTMLFDDDTHGEHSPTYLPHESVYTYLCNYAERHSLVPLISLRTTVRRVTKHDDGTQWTVQTDDGVKGSSSRVHLFDAIFVCTGNYTYPRWPSDIDVSKLARVRHSAHYKTPHEYVDKTVLVIGAGPSGRDITAEISEVARKVYVSHASTLPVFASDVRPANVAEVSKIETVYFDGSVKVPGVGILSVDCTICCTGYRRRLPFVADGTGGVAFCIAVLKGDIDDRHFTDLVEADREKNATAAHDKYFHALGKQRWAYVNDLARLSGTRPVPQSLIELDDYARGLRRRDPSSFREVQLELTGDDSGMWRVKR